MSATVAPAATLAVGGVPYEAVIGIECHVELKTETKMFCGCRNIFGGEPNVNVCPVCLGMPGALPVPNRLAIEAIVKAGLAFGAEVPAFSKFDRKNYFYPDMPKNYQISQFDMPFTLGGTVSFWLEDGTQRTIRLTRIHLEEDTGKSLHAGSADGRLGGSTYSLVDFNRAGVPLMECVSEPEIRSAAEAVAYLDALKRTFVALGVSDVKMEEGSLRCDANVSVRPVGALTFGTKTEIKNMNSFRSVFHAIDHEIARQVDVLASGGRIVQETRGWDEAAGTTIVQRSKEEAHDYRYFPDPDLVPIEFAPADRERLCPDLAELPQARLKRLIADDTLSVKQAQQIIDTPGLFAYYKAVVALGPAPQLVVNFLLGELARLANEAASPTASSKFSPQAVAEIVELTASNTINSKTAKDLIGRVWSEGGSPAEIVAREGLAQVSDPAAVDAFVREVMALQAKSVADFKNGKENVMKFLVGQVMKASRGTADPVLAEERLRALIG
jgi:aspartyl-tRNA(Asn)/glutamyl-tRNA(Gln) amidotransferase subunit B